MQIHVVNGWLELGYPQDIEPRQPVAPAPPSVPAPPVAPIVPPVVPQPPQMQPWVSVGSATGKAGEIVRVSVHGYCPNPTSGWHIGLGCGNWTIRPTGVDLGHFFKNFLGGVPPSFNELTYYDSEGANAAIGPSAFMEHGFGMWVNEKGELLNPVSVPAGTLLFTVQFQIPDGEKPAKHTLIATQDFWHTQDDPFRKHYEFTGKPHAYNIAMDSGTLEVIA